MSATTTLPDTLTGAYALDAGHSRFGFVARHAMVTKVRGSFTDVEGHGHFDEEDPSKSSLSVTIQAASVTTRNPDRETHLRSPDFFDVENHPVITFESTSVDKQDDSNYRVTGDLTIRGVTKPVTIDFALTGPAIDPWGNVRLGLEGRSEVNRKDWGLTWNAALEAGGVLVSEKVILEFDVAAVRQSDDA